MKLYSTSFADQTPIPVEFAFGKIDPVQHVALSDNKNPHLAWSEVPVGTQSFAIICHDYDVPSRGDDVNQEGKTVPASLPRVDFFHWTVWNIPASIREIAAGSQSNGITAHGKSGPAAPAGFEHGINDYTAWFAGDASMSGSYFGYDGPCPPWNDAIPHHYVFTLYALDIPALSPADHDGASIRKALQGHILAEATLTGIYSLNPAVPV